MRDLTLPLGMFPNLFRPVALGRTIAVFFGVLEPPPT
jgi:hypothetical protein